MAAIYFGAGPAALPREVLEEASRAILDYNNSGLSILEIPHRGSAFKDIIEEASALAKDLLGLDEDYEALWLQGGGRLQFSMVPMNLLSPDKTAGYVNSGHWADEALKAARMYGNINELASSEKEHYKFIPTVPEIPRDLSYVYITTNNTIYGTQFHELPDTGTVPLVADMSSELYSRKLDYNKIDLIMAVAQKNIGPAGVTLVLGRKSLLETQVRELPGMLSYKEQLKHGSMLNTPPVFAVYCSMLVLRWVKKIGLQALDEINTEKARLLYDAIDNSKLFYGVAEAQSRSKMNVCFRARNDAHTDAFAAFAAEKGIQGIKGHRSVGGFRASLYNAVSMENVKALVAALQSFEQKNA